MARKQHLFAVRLCLCNGENEGIHQSVRNTIENACIRETNLHTFLAVQFPGCQGWNFFLTPTIGHCGLHCRMPQLDRSGRGYHAQKLGYILLPEIDRQAAGSRDRQTTSHTKDGRRRRGACWDPRARGEEREMSCILLSNFHACITH